MNNTKKIGKFLCASVMLVVIIALLSGCGNKKEEQKSNEAYEEPVKNMVEGMQNTNVEQYMKAFPDFINYKITQSDLDEIMEIYIQQYGQHIKLYYEITGKEEIQSNKLLEIQENIKIYYNHESKVTKGYKLEINNTIKGSIDQQTSKNSINVYEIDGKWYVLTF